MKQTPAPTPASVDAAVSLLSALAHPLRLRTLLMLGREGPSSVGSLWERLEVEQSALSHQLRVLKDHRLVTGTRQGKRVVYALTDRHVERLVEDALAHAGGLCLEEEGP